VKSSSRVKKLTMGIVPADWQPTSSEGREVAPVPAPIAYDRPVRQFAVRTPSTEQPSGYYLVVLLVGLAHDLLI
jgi:hypothetical protein